VSWLRNWLQAWWWKLLPRQLRPRDDRTATATTARVEAERKLRAARRDWPKVEAAHDDLADWLDSALGRGR
jgi:hypothetical protein